MHYSITPSLKEYPEFETYLRQQLQAFNDKHSLPHRQARDAIKHLQLIVTDQEGCWQGGITAQQYWDWLELDVFWLPEELRGQGLGSSLLARIEAMGQEHGARKVLLTTFEFQARTFYERHGYTVVGTVEDYPPGSCYYTMVKKL
ncbi:acetyltransferase (GNAT) family protein [Thermosporothrix hazakensis]|jgi:GNAT superfamily N-acetyltransferase|uniref:Acetyltransferase (GNAT) family protein n=1 Tax=Thermosporothrix hazakensis TaxID=644383 RepID=A0A326UJK1_THEHA|nr:GNAT family N-acetyltransferase [Thermosporothrix hazakensis]PZW32673.1 acetyltransferase (GNAT) family protein [Thermosporothrix hazakensis]GCE50025.1 hypothetical protein KTH_48940 [Thermosporothrix hazakensis]